MMRLNEIAGPASHPYVVTIYIDPVDFWDFERRMDNHPELKLLDYDNSTPDRWAVRVGCASVAAAERLSDAWG